MIWVPAAVLAVITAVLTVLLFDRYMRWKRRRTGLEVFYVAMQDDLPDLYALLEATYRRSEQPPVLDYNFRPGCFVSVAAETREGLRTHSRGLFQRTRPYFHLLPAKAIAAILEVRRVFGSLDTKQEKVSSEDVLSAKLRLQVLGDEIGLIERAAGDQSRLVPKR
jgi:hypothetical protein